MSPSIPVAVTLPGQGKVLRALGDEVTVLLSGEQTGGAFTMVQVVTPPGGGPPPHWHEREDEWFYILEGRVEFWQEGTPLRMIVHAAPAGFEVFFERLAEVCAAPGGPDMGRIVEISGEFGIHFVPPGA